LTASARNIELLKVGDDRPTADARITGTKHRGGD